MPIRSQNKELRSIHIAECFTRATINVHKNVCTNICPLFSEFKVNKKPLKSWVLMLFFRGFGFRKNRLFVLRFDLAKVVWNIKSRTKNQKKSSAVLKPFHNVTYLLLIFITVTVTLNLCDYPCGKYILDIV